MDSVMEKRFTGLGINGLEEQQAREKKAVKEVLQVLAANNLTANEINTVLGQVNEAFSMRPLTREFVEEYFKDESKFRACFFVR